MSSGLAICRGCGIMFQGKGGSVVVDIQGHTPIEEHSLKCREYFANQMVHICAHFSRPLCRRLWTPS